MAASQKLFSPGPASMATRVAHSGGSCGREAPAASEASQLASEAKRASKLQYLKLGTRHAKNYT